MSLRSFLPSFLPSFLRVPRNLATLQPESAVRGSPSHRPTSTSTHSGTLTQTLTLTTHVPSPARTTVLTVLALVKKGAFDLNPFERREFPRTKGRAWTGVVASIIMVRSIAGKNHQKNGAEVQCAIVVVEEAIVRLAGWRLPGSNGLKRGHLATLPERFVSRSFSPGIHSFSIEGYVVWCVNAVARAETEKTAGIRL